MEIAEIVKIGKKRSKVRFVGEVCTRTLRNETIREFLKKEYPEYLYLIEDDYDYCYKEPRKTTIVETTEIYW